MRYYIRTYLIMNDMFTGGSSFQYDKMIELLEKNMIREGATVIWACSTTDKTLEEIESDINDIFAQL